MSYLPKSPQTLLRELIAIPSVNPSFGGSGEAAIADYVEALLGQLGLSVGRQVVFPGGRDNIYAVIGDREKPAILLEAHLDTVAAAEWFEGSPFVPIEREGRIYGRGACDTKGSLAVFLAVAAYFAGRPEELEYQLVIAATIDEEEFQTGAFRLMELDFDLVEAITGEPTSLDLISAHKGVLRFRVRAEGVAAHSAFPEKGVNAIGRLAKAIVRLERYAEALRGKPPHPTLGTGTLNIGTVRGGEAVNIVPDRAVIDVDRRLLPGERGSAVIAEIRELLADLEGVIVEEPLLDRPGIDSPNDGEPIGRLAAAIEQETGGCNWRSAPYMTNAAAYAEAGIPCHVFGPGDIADAHTINESIEIDQLDRAVRILIDFLRKPTIGSEGGSGTGSAE